MTDEEKIKKLQAQLAAYEQNGAAKLTDDQARQIRSRYRYGNAKLLAEEFGVSRATISLIVNGKRRTVDDGHRDRPQVVAKGKTLFD